MDAQDLARYDKANRPARKPAQRKWVVVANPGTADEAILIQCNTLKATQRWCKQGMVVMKRCADGNLTAEY